MTPWDSIRRDKIQSINFLPWNHLYRPFMLYLFVIKIKTCAEPQRYDHRTITSLSVSHRSRSNDPDWPLLHSPRYYCCDSFVIRRKIKGCSGHFWEMISCSLRGTRGGTQLINRRRVRSSAARRRALRIPLFPPEEHDARKLQTWMPPSPITIIWSVLRMNRSDGLKSLHLSEFPAMPSLSFESTIRWPNLFSTISSVSSNRSFLLTTGTGTGTDAGDVTGFTILSPTDFRHFEIGIMLCEEEEEEELVVDLSPADEWRPETRRLPIANPHPVETTAGLWSELGFSSSIGSCCVLTWISETRRISSGWTWHRHKGHVEWASSHVSTHSTWNPCLHLGSNRSSSVESNRERQTAHSRPSFSPWRAPNRNKGRDSTTDLSTPELRGSLPVVLLRSWALFLFP